jgi:hypothetical protein
MLAAHLSDGDTMTRGRWFWLAGLTAFVVLVVLFPTTGVTACSDPGGCVNQGTDTWVGLVRWPFSANWAIWTYALSTVALGMVLIVTAIRTLRRSRQTVTN